MYNCICLICLIICIYVCQRIYVPYNIKPPPPTPTLSTTTHTYSLPHHSHLPSHLPSPTPLPWSLCNAARMSPTALCMRLRVSLFVFLYIYTARVSWSHFASCEHLCRYVCVCVRRCMCVRRCVCVRVFQMKRRQEVGGGVIVRSYLQLMDLTLYIYICIMQCKLLIRIK